MEEIITKKCPRCQKLKGINDFWKNKRTKDGLNNYCIACGRELNQENNLRHGHKYVVRHKNYWKEHRDEKAPGYYAKATEIRKQAYSINRKIVIEHYGGKCACCGESRYEFLAIDHKNGGGNQMRKNKAHPRATNQLVIWIIEHDFPDTFRILCHNCNCARGYYGYCPHERETK